ncbi:MAG: carbon-nitrogen hydrolase [Acidobacteria bacterium]|nr:MAG: carbon-nitrogen hydrolase [Acidobacteriota bacterium]
MARRRALHRRPTPLRIALAQMEPVLGDFEANVARHLVWARRAVGRGAQLLIFPELSLTGYSLQDLVADVAVPLHEPGRIRALLDMSRRIPMVVGLVEETQGHRYHNSAVFLSGGRACHVHRKVYLPTYGMFDEGRFFAAGDRLEAFPTPFGRMGLLVCEDFWHPSTALILAQDGADYLLVISAGPTEGVDRRRGLIGQATWRDLVKVTAQMQTMFIVYVNRVGFEDGVNFAGGSCVFDPFGEALAEGPILEESLVVCDLERSALRRARTMFPLLRDERLPVLAREVQRLMGFPAVTRARRTA